MKRRLLYLTTILLFMSVLQATEIITDTVKFQEIRAKNVVLQDPVFEIQGAIEKPDSYILKLLAKSAQGSQFLTVFLDKNTSEIYIGSGYDKEGKQITFPKDVQTIKKGVAFSYGSGTKEIYLITDPECPYCVRFEQAVNGRLSEYTVHVILFPLPFHKNAPAMIEWIMQGKTDAEKKEKFEALMLKGSTEYRALVKDNKTPFVYSPAVEAYIQRSELASMEFNMRGTPAIYNADFEPMAQSQLLMGSK